MSLVELAPEPIVFLDVPPGEQVFRGAFDAVGATPNFRYRTVSFEHVRALIARGLAYGLAANRAEVGNRAWGEEAATKPVEELLSRIPCLVPPHGLGPGHRRSRRLCLIKSMSIGS